MEQPKFKLGQLVKVRFDGDVIGIPVSVYLDAYVYWIMWKSPKGSARPCYSYGVAEHWETENDGRGRTWDEIAECRMQAVEPIVEAIATAAAS